MCVFAHLFVTASTFYAYKCYDRSQQLVDERHFDGTTLRQDSELYVDVIVQVIDWGVNVLSGTAHVLSGIQTL